MAVTWQRDVIPVEIFSLIISYLPRSSVQNMRLVNKEFEEKVAHDLFQTVVVPFNPEIYGIAEEPSTGNSQSGASVMFQDRGMRVFQGFGRHIYRFGMSFEFNYSLLTNPPMKSDQEYLTAFWGIYRWPFKKYNRYHQLEGLEQVADETRTMAKALRFMMNSKELGISIDGGLGWLAGPDTTHNTQMPSERPCVFGESRFCPEEKSSLPCSPEGFGGTQTPALRGPLNAVTDTTDELGVGAQIPAFIQMLREAGYEGFDLAQSVRTLIESEGLPQSSQTSPGLSATVNVTQNSDRSDFPDPVYMESYLRGFGYGDVRLEQIRGALTQTISSISEPSSTQISDNDPLKPNDLTTAQKEMLLETEWAQRAFLQSYTIAIIDNQATFQGIETLSLARLPGRHLNILNRNDFWYGLSQLKKVSLAIIPDWREVIKLPTSWVEDIRVQPSRAIPGVYQLLKDHIAPRISIKTLHFEWLCGGEEATGLYARNQLILAAPLVPHPTEMIQRRELPMRLLTLPHVEHLTLKNCWISPHVMVRFVESLREKALATLTLQSVSLTAPTIRDSQSGPGNLPNNLAPQLNMNGQGQLAAQIMNLPPQQHYSAIQAFVLQQQPIFQVQPNINLYHGPVVPTPIAFNQPMVYPDAWPFRPRFGSWAHVIDQISPGETIVHFLKPLELESEKPSRRHSHLKSLIFDSCGYVRLPVDFDQTMLDSSTPLAGDTLVIAKRRKEMAQYMMKPQDHAVGCIVNYINEHERECLETVWNMHMGWGGGCMSLIVQALIDGIKAPGHGRFRGKINALSPSYHTKSNPLKKSF